ncbi:hypothetical protein Taro_030809, partial [Colocasia esculenta]|nr:hypothetical protein [Colocasia esculenta]
ILPPIERDRILPLRRRRGEEVCKNPVGEGELTGETAMKCHSVACLWSGPPALHRVTAAAALADPPTLYTGGSDGSIFWWNISTPQSTQEVRPMAMLCGHAAAIADLCICTPMAAPSGEERPGSTVRSSDSPACHASLLSACVDGVLCVWSRGSGHCRRRRKLPPWAGTPHALSPLPLSPRYVCVACSCAESSMHTSSSHVAAPPEGPDRDEAGAEREAPHRKPPKWAILIVDSYSLNIVQTVLHGGLPIGPLKCMNVVPDSGNGRKHDVVMADAFGKVRSMVVPADPHQDGETGTVLYKSASSEAVSSVLGEALCEGANAVSVSADGALLLLVYTTRFVVKSILNVGIAKEVPLADSPLCSQDTSPGAHLIGGTFLQRDGGGARFESQDSEQGSAMRFSVWSTNGAALIYSVTLSDINFTVELQCEIPSLSYPSNVNVLVQFCQWGYYFVRIESIAFDVSGSLLWQPHVTAWTMPQLRPTHVDGSGALGRQLDARTNNNSDGTSLAVQLCEGGFQDDNTSSWASLSKVELSCGTKADSKEEGSSRGSLSCGVVNSPLWDRRTVSSSMVLSEDFHAPYAVVYGFYSGEIEIVQLGSLFPKVNLADGPKYPGTSLCIRQQSFSGHTGAVLCLAAHRMVVASNNHNALRILISGGLDWTVRLWDLDAGDIVMVMHHHVAPVRQIILPAPGTDHPWSDCFLSIGEDSCVALSSLETLCVERMFPGHPCYPSMVAWDSPRGYIACLCRNLLSPSDAVNSLYVWDVKTGVRERILHGTASYSMFDHFCKGINLNANTGNILGGTTSASSLLLSLNKDARVSKTQIAGLHKGIQPAHMNMRRSTDLSDLNDPLNYRKVETGGFINSATRNNSKHPIKCSCPFPGIAAFEFDLSLLMSLCQINRQSTQTCDSQNKVNMGKQEISSNPSQKVMHDGYDVQCTEGHPVKESLEGFLLRFSLSFLHLWNIDHELDKLLVGEMNIHKPGPFVASGVLGDRGSLTLIFPDMHSTLELWKCSSEFCAMRSLTIVSLTQRMICLSISSSAASSELAAFYTRNFAEKVPDIKPPLLQLLVSFWQDSSEFVRMAARSLFHCAAPRAVPHTLYWQKMVQPATFSNSTDVAEDCGKSDEGAPMYEVPNSDNDDSSIVHWLESYEMQDWVSCIGGTAQDAMAAHIIVAAALAVWYPSIVKSKVAKLVVEQVVKLVMAMNDRYSSTAAELLAEGMDSMWKTFIGHEIPHLIGDVVNYVLQTMDHGNLVMRKVCIHSSMAMLREVARVFPMVALNERASRLAMGDAVGGQLDQARGGTPQPNWARPRDAMLLTCSPCDREGHRTLDPSSLPSTVAAILPAKGRLISAAAVTAPLPPCEYFPLPFFAHA